MAFMCDFNSHKGSLVRARLRYLPVASSTSKATGTLTPEVHISKTH